MRSTLRMSLLALSAFGLSNCSTPMSALREDLRNHPDYEIGTHGGQYPERSMLSADIENEYLVIPSKGERLPASSYYADGTKSPTWIKGDEFESSQRDRYRDVASTGQALPMVKREYRDKGRATKEDFYDRKIEEGSLWASNGQTNYLFTNNRIKSPGDIISIKIGDALFKGITEEIKQTLSDEEYDAEINLAQEKLVTQARESKKGSKGSSAGAGGPKPAAAKGEAAPPPEEEELDVRPATYADIDVTPSVGIKAGDKVMGEVVERFPNGNYKVRATKRIPYRGTTRIINVLAIASAPEIEGKDEVDSERLYEYRIKAAR